jgi:lysophospholipase L1-like esterase
VSGFVFYDENANGTLDPTETVRLPGVTVAVASAVGQSSSGGRFTLSNVPAGTQTAQARADTLPAYFTPGAPVPVSVPPAGDVAVPAVLALGSGLRANTYMAFGDSITAGDGSGDGTGYQGFLRANLTSYWGKANVIDDGLSGSKSSVGLARLPGDLPVIRPAYLLILYGTNDWNLAECRNAPPCSTIDNLRGMIDEARAAGVNPVLGTIPPVNPNYADKDAVDRNNWVNYMDDLVRKLAAEERVSLADIQADFLKQPSLPPLFSDFVHPNDAGYSVMAGSWFAAITQPLSASASRRSSFFFRLPGS